MAFNGIEDRLLRVNQVAADPRVVLAGGGNYSEKTPRYMLIKASGSFMFSMGRRDLTVVRRRTIDDALEHEYDKIPRLREARYKAFLEAAKTDPNSRRPSVETAVHHLFNQRYVLHTHATALTILLSVVDAQDKMNAILGREYVLMPFIDPGIELAKVAGTIIEPGKNLAQRNHGIFFASDDFDALIREHNGEIARATEYIDDMIQKKGLDRQPFGRADTSYSGFRNQIKYRQIMESIYRNIFGEDPTEPIVRQTIEDGIPALRIETKKGTIYLWKDGLARAYAESEMVYDNAGRLSWLTPDNIVSMWKTDELLRLNDPTDSKRVAEDIKEQKRTYEGGLMPRVYVIQGVGIATVAGHHPDDAKPTLLAKYAMQLTNDALIQYRGTRAIGTPTILTPANANFIVNWEVEDTRRLAFQQQKS